MKNLVNSKYLPLFMAGLGVVGFCLRKGLYAVALDHKNLLLAGHPLQWLLFLVTAAAIALVVIYGMAKEQSKLLWESKLTAAGCLVLAVGILVSLLPEGFAAGGLSRLRFLLGLLAAAAMVAAGVQSFLGKPAFFLLPGLVCIFCAVHMLSCYQSWSSNPQILDYLYTLLSSVGLMLFAYQRSALAADCGSEKLAKLFGCITLFCGLTALSGTEYPWLCLAGSIWAFTGLLSRPAEETE